MNSSDVTGTPPSALGKYEVVIGLEVHVQLLTKTKLFCGCSTDFGAPPNSHVCPVCLGHPGVLPVTNRRAIELALRVALATDCTIYPQSIFARKNYFYPDSPKAYQISQYEEPLCEQGSLQFRVGGAEAPLQSARIHRIHLEEDAGKSKHGGPHGGSQIDLNRCGVPLIEIVGEPDLRSPQEAVAYLTTLKQLVEYLEVCDGNMEEGSFRCDANVSLRPRGVETLGTRTELKNINSFRFVERALQFEIARQVEVIEGGSAVVQETRLWDETDQVTRSMRGKEDAHDYRYFPDPDLPPVLVEAEWIDRVRQTLPELPEAKRYRFEQTYGLSAEPAAALTQSRALGEFFEAVVERAGDARLAANWVLNEWLGRLHRRGETPEASSVSAAHLGSLVAKVKEGSLSGKLAKFALDKMIESGEDPETIVKRHGWTVVSDDGALEAMIEKAMAANPDEVAGFRAGKQKLLQFFVGQVMRESKGQANPQRLRELLERALRGQ